MSNNLKKILKSLVEEMNATGDGAYMEPGSNEAPAHSKAFKKKKKLKEASSDLSSQYVAYLKEFEEMKMGDIARNPKVGQDFIAKGQELEELLKDSEDSRYWKLGSQVFNIYSIIEDMIEKIQKIKALK